ncbi:hypothetical protein D3C78_1218790 [compost metagenome]
MKTGDNHVQRREHWAGTVDFAVRIFNIGLNTTQYPDAINQTWPDTHIHKMPIVRRISHIRTVIGNGEKLDAFQPSLRDVVMEGAVSMGTGDGVHMQVNGIHRSLL